MASLHVSDETRRLVARLPTGPTRLGTPRLRRAYGLTRMTAIQRERIARELHAAGLAIDADPYGIVVDKPTGLRAGVLRLDASILRAAGRARPPAPAPVVEPWFSADRPVRRTHHPLRRPPSQARRVVAVGAVAAVLAAAAVGSGQLDEGPARPTRAAAAAAVAQDDYSRALALATGLPSPGRDYVRTRIARRLGVRATRAVGVGHLGEAGVLLAAARTYPLVVEVQRARRSLDRRLDSR